jgi:hypothetical protein
MRQRSQTNFLPLVETVYSQSMKVDNYLASDEGNRGESVGVVAAQQDGCPPNGVHSLRADLRGVLHDGFAVPEPCRGSNEGAFIRGLSPRQMTACTGNPSSGPRVTPVDDDWPIMALEIKGGDPLLRRREGVLRRRGERPPVRFGLARTHLRQRLKLRIHRHPAPTVSVCARWSGSGTAGNSTGSSSTESSNR